MDSFTNNVFESSDDAENASRDWPMITLYIMYFTTIAALAVVSGMISASESNIYTIKPVGSNRDSNILNTAAVMGWVTATILIVSAIFSIWYASLKSVVWLLVFGLIVLFVQGVLAGVARTNIKGDGSARTNQKYIDMLLRVMLISYIVSVIFVLILLLIRTPLSDQIKEGPEGLFNSEHGNSNDIFPGYDPIDNYSGGFQARALY